MKGFRQVIRELFKDPMGRTGMIAVLLLIMVSIFAPQLAHYAPEKMVSMPKAAPNGQFWFGTDNYGRDIYSRILYGARVSLQVGIISVGIAASIGFLLGMIAGYFEGTVDRIIMCFMDILFAFPSILLAIFITAVLGRGIENTMIAIGIVNIPVFVRTVRAFVISAKGLEYVQNAKSIGVKTFPLLLRHIAPNTIAPFTVQATLALSSAILTEASMSFLGLGIQPPDPSWGSMLSEARAFMEQAPWMAIFPVLFIILTILVFNILGDSLRDVLDPKLKT